MRFSTNPGADQETKPETYSRWSKIESVVLWYGFCVVAVQSILTTLSVYENQRPGKKKNRRDMYSEKKFQAQFDAT